MSTRNCRHLSFDQHRYVSGNRLRDFALAPKSYLRVDTYRTYRTHGTVPTVPYGTKRII